MAELQAGDGFFTPEQGAQIVVKCILGAFYGNNPVNSNVKVNEKTTIDGHDAWLVESQLTFDIPGLEAKGELPHRGNRLRRQPVRPLLRHDPRHPSRTRAARPGHPEAAAGRRLVQRPPEGLTERFLQAVRLVTTSFVHMGLTPSAHKLCP